MKMSLQGDELSSVSEGYVWLASVQMMGRIV
jgi:hypothetical protein